MRESLSMTARLRAAVALTRPVNCVLTALSVGVGALTAGSVHADLRLAAAAVAAAAIAGAGNTLNDVLDLPVDRRNRPDRPLPAGRIGPGAALLLAAVLGSGGLALAWALGPLTGWIALAVTSGLAAYNWGLKRAGWPGNLVVSLLAAATFPFGAAAVRGGGRWWVPAGFAVLYHLGRELVKGAEDMPGDAVAGVRTVARAHGPRVASRLAAACFLLVGLVAPLPSLVGIYGRAYLVAVLVLETYLAVTARRLWHQPPRPGPAHASRRLLAGMALGLLAVVLGEWLDRP